ncbi:MAG: hypothetical protein KAR13_21525 [Desulfobulbaceae bacterium]|nr:hypothetical protein [Desulfobulbaceae bacterium]
MLNYSISADRRKYLYGSFLFIIFISILMTGCASHERYYFYNGNPLPASQVAFVGVHSTLTMINFDTIPMRNKKLTASFDILPGEHTLDLAFGSTAKTYSVTTVSKGAIATLKLNTEPGHIYYIYPSFPTRDTWQPKAVDIAKADDLSNIPPYVWDSIPVPDEHKKSYILSIRRKFERHFQKKQNHSLRVSERKNWE